MISADADAAYQRIRFGASRGEDWESDWETVYRAIWPVLVARVSERGLSEFAADAVQAALLTVLIRTEIIGQLDTFAGFTAYMTTVSRNKAIDAVRRAMRNISLSVTNDSAEVGDIPDPRAAGIDPLFLYAPTQLSKEDHDLMRMFYVEGRTYREIAETLGTSEQSIKSRMFRLQQVLARARDGTAGQRVDSK